jgi:hypothetical protein
MAELIDTVSQPFAENAVKYGSADKSLPDQEGKSYSDRRF